MNEICGCVDCGNSRCYDFGGDGYCFEYNKLMKLAKWKDARQKEQRRIIRNHYQEWAEEQIAKEKQQLIDKLEDWLANNICTAHNFRGDNISATFMNDCIKAMKGE